MVHKIVIGLVVLLTNTACFGQTPIHGLVAGQSVRTDVERVAGKPVAVYSQTLVEYHPQESDPKAWQNVAKMYVQYRTNSPIVERIEVLLGRPINRSDAFKLLEVSTAAAHQPHLPDQPTARGKNGERLVEYFGAPFYMVLTYQGADTNSGVARTARYSKELFDSAVSSLGRSPVPPSGASGPAQSTTAGTTGPPLARAGASPVPPSGASGPAQSTTAGSTRPSLARVGPSPASAGASAATNGSVSGRWSGSWTNSNGDSGQSSINIKEQNGTITGEEDTFSQAPSLTPVHRSGWTILNGHRTGNVLTWEYRNQYNGCRDYTVRWELSADGKLANGTFKVTDRCAKQTYTGSYLNYHR